MTSTDFRNIALSFPGTSEDPHFHKTSFRIQKKIFATLDECTGMGVVKLTAVDQSVYCAIDGSIIYPVTGKWGLQGWTSIAVTKIKKPLLKEVMGAAYQSVAAKKTAAKK